MRAILCVMLSAAPAFAGVHGDLTAGAGADSESPHTRLGLRGAVGNESVELAAGIDWAYVLAPGGAEDLNAWEQRVRFLAGLAFPFALSPEDMATVQVGGGLEVARRAEMGTYPPTAPHSTDVVYEHGYVLEARASYGHAVGPVDIGAELAVGHSSYSRTYADLLGLARWRW